MAAISQPNPISTALLSAAAPDYQIQQLKAQRAYALAQALQEQGLAPIDGHGGSISWTQGLAKLAEALSGNLANRYADKNMASANQALAQGLRGMFGGTPAPQTAQAAPSDGAPMPQGGQMPSAVPPAPPAPPQPGPPPAPGLGNSPFPVANGVDPLSPDAPPQAASTPPPAPPLSAPAGGAPQRGPWSLTGNPQQDFALYMSNPDEYSKALIANSAKGGAPTDMEVMFAHARDAMARGDVGAAAALLSNIQKQNYIPQESFRPGGWSRDPATGKLVFHPQAPIPGAVPGPPDANGNMTWQVPAGTEEAVAERAHSQSAGEASGKAPFQFQQVYNQQTGQMEYVPVSQMAGGGSGPLNSYYGHGGQQAATPSGGHTFAASPPIGAQAAANTYGSGSANAFIATQDIANNSPQRVQALREMEDLLRGGFSTGPTQQKMQDLAEHMGLSFLAKDNAFVFNKDAARFVAQSAADLSLNGSDARLGMVANASPNMKMTPQALKVVLPVMVGLEYAKMAKATAAANFAQRNPGGNAQFESEWRANYDPRMFTAYAEGGPKALASAPASLRAEWLRKYRTLKSMGVNFGAFAQ